MTATSAELQAQVDPAGGATTYHFEYGTSTAYGQSTPEATLNGTDDSPHPAAASVTELQPATEYHFRLVAHNASGGESGTTAYGPDSTFTTQTGQRLDGTPGRASLGIGDAGQERRWNRRTSRASAQLRRARSGICVGQRDHIFFHGPISWHRFRWQRALEVEQYISERAGNGRWETGSLGLPSGEAGELNAGSAEPYRLFNEDLTDALAEPADPAPLSEGSPEAGSASEAEWNVYERDNATASFTRLVDAPGMFPPATESGTSRPSILGASPDFSAVVVGSPGILKTSSPPKPEPAPVRRLCTSVPPADSSW